MKDGVSTWEQAVLWLRQQSDQQALVEAAYYDDPLLLSAMRYHASNEWSAVKMLLPERPSEALDVGAGRGIASYALAKEGYDVAALEPDESPLVGTEAIRGLARESGLPIDVYQGFSEALPFPDAQFGLVFARSVLHHSRDLGTACGEIYRVLQSGGRFLAIREHVISKTQDLDAFLESHPLHRIYGGENAYLLNQYQKALRDVGFEIDHVIGPLDSPMNFATNTSAMLQGEVARRVAFGAPWLEALAETVLRLPGLWRFLLPVLRRLDQRPGRLYSFVCRRP